jgi:hypothetical protein
METSPPERERERKKEKELKNISVKVSNLLSIQRTRTRAIQIVNQINNLRVAVIKLKKSNFPHASFRVLSNAHENPP